MVMNQEGVCIRISAGPPGDHTGTSWFGFHDGWLEPERGQFGGDVLGRLALVRSGVRGVDADQVTR